MKITTSIGWNRKWLQQVVRFCCQVLEYPPSSVAHATFTLCHNADSRGIAYWRKHSIRVKINPLNLYPITDMDSRTLPVLILADAVELLVLIIAHEVAHLERWDRLARRLIGQGKRDTFLEADTERHARRVLAAFRTNREALLAAWGESGSGPVAPPVVHRLSCPDCGRTWDFAARPAKAYRRGCGACFPKNWAADAAVGRFLTYARVPRQAPIASVILPVGRNQ